MFAWLLNIGLILVTFFTIPGIDVRDIKMTVALNMGLTLCLAGLYYGFSIQKTNINKCFMFFIGYLIVSHIYAPNPDLIFLGMDVGNFWIWQPMLNFFVFGLMLLIISSRHFTETELSYTTSVIIWLGVITAIYVILQRLNLDQFFSNVGHDFLGRMGGAIGNPTHVSPFIAMIVPLTLFFRKYWISIIMILAVCLTQSQVAIVSMILGIMTYYACKNRLYVFISGLILTLFITLFSFYMVNNYDKAREFVSDNQRFLVWEAVIKDVNERPFKEVDKKFPLTGWGSGNFKYTFHLSHYQNPSMQKFYQAHNDWFELLYNNGIIGFGLFMLCLFLFFKSKWDKITTGEITAYERAFLGGFICMSISAFGTFIWQVGTTAFFTVVFVGILNNQEACNAKNIYFINLFGNVVKRAKLRCRSNWIC